MNIWWNGTSRHSVSFTALAATVLDSGTIQPALLSCSNMEFGGASEETVDSMLEIIESGKEYLVA